MSRTIIPADITLDDLLDVLTKLNHAIEKLNRPNKNSFLTGQKAVAATTIAEQLVEQSVPISDGFSLTIVAKPANTGYVYIGISKADAEGAYRYDGIKAGEVIHLRITNANLVWVGVSVATEGVSWIVELNR